MEKWVHQHPRWPDFTYNPDGLPVSRINELESDLENLLTGVDIEMIKAVQLESLLPEIMSNSRIEGVSLPEDSVRSSLFRRLAINSNEKERFDRRAQNCMELMIDAVSNSSPMTSERLFDWQMKALAGTGWDNVPLGRYRNEEDGPMKVVSGAIGFEKIHYKAVDGSRVKGEMESFLKWLNANHALPSLAKAALAHLRFVLIHPFGDGNGRIARSISDYIIAKERPKLVVFAGMSVELLHNKKEYMEQLDRIDGLDATNWVAFIYDTRIKSLEKSIRETQNILLQHHFLHQAKNLGCSSRQMDVLHKITRSDFKGKLNVRRYSKIAKCLREDAKMEIENLTQKGLLIKNGKGHIAALRMPNDNLSQHFAENVDAGEDDDGPCP